MEIEVQDGEVHLDLEDLDEDPGDLEDGVRRARRTLFQQQLSANFHLPYHCLLDVESSLWLAEIKEGLSKSVITGDYRPGLIIWITKLEQYLRLYGRRFSKDEHVQLIHLFFDLMTDEHMEAALVNRMCQILSDLLQKKELLSPEDLELEWKKLYATYERFQYNRDEWHGLINVPDTMERNLSEAVIRCRPYFSADATQEMLNTWRPLLCPHSTSMKKAIRYFSLFLPTIMHAGRESWKLWFDELIGIWLAFSAVPNWENDVISLLARLALDNVGRIDWCAYIPVIFTKYLRNLRLPVGKKRLKLVFGNRSFDIGSAAVWPVAMMHHQACLDSLENLFKAVESYFYPSNNGEWSAKLSGMLMRLPLVVVARLNAERYRKPSWLPETPSAAHLTDTQVTRFVTAMKPIVLLNMYSKNIGARLESMFALKSLAELCPDQIIPELLDRLYPSLDSVTEPHRLTATMSAMTICMRSLFDVNEGKKHVLPLMVAVLPGIDSNDYRKSTCTFQFLTCLLSMVPLEDSSRFADRDDLNEEERALCIESSGFEDFALQCLERCLMYISNSTNDLHGRHDSVSRDINERMTHEEKFTRLGMTSLVATIIYQSSDQICESVLQKLFSFIANRNLSYNHYTGVAVASFCSMSMKLRPKVAEREILEPILKLLKVRVSLRGHDILTDEAMDDETAWTVKLVVETLAASGRAILAYKSTLMPCLETLLRAKSSALYKLVVNIFKALLRGLLITFPINIKSVVPGELNMQDPLEYVPVRHWCQLINQRDLKIDWHIPDDEEMDFAQELMQMFLMPAFAKLNSYCHDDTRLERKELERTLLLVEMFLLGAAVKFPFDSTLENRILPCETHVEIYSQYPDPVVALSQRVITIDGLPARQYIFERIRLVLHKISASDEDDVKSIKIILRMFRALMFYRGLENEELQNRIKSHIVSRKQMSRSLGNNKEQMRLLLFERTFIQHERRHYDHRGSPLTLLRAGILREMIKLATGQYKDIRILGQNYFQDGMSNIRFAYRAFVDEIINNLDDSKDSSERSAQMKGSLYLILGGKGGSLALKHDWHTLSKCFPCLTKVNSESKTVALVFDKLADKMDRHFSTTAINIKPALPAIRTAEAILRTGRRSGEDISDGPLIDAEAIWEKRALESKDNEKLYFELVNELLDFVRERLTKPKNFHFALFVLSYLIRRDVAVVPNMIDTFMDNWANPSSEKARKLAQHPMLSFMRWLKRPIVRMQISPRFFSKYSPAAPLTPEKHAHAYKQPVAGIRDDNLWLCFNESLTAKSAEEYESTVFVEKIQHGYYGWPATLVVAAPVKDQVGVGKMPDSLNALEKIIYEKMTDESYVDILIRLLSVEDSKLHGKFDKYSYWIFRGMFRHFEDAFLPLLLPSLEKLIQSKEEHQHRCAAEILAGIIRGSKRWPYKKISALWEQLTPIIRSALTNLTNESLADWGEFAHSGLNEGDSRRTYPLLRLLFDLPKTDTSFQASSRLYVLQSAFLVSYDWRRKELHMRIVELMKERLQERYRDRVAWTLANVYRCQIELPNLNRAIEQGPRVTTFIEQQLPKCRQLLLISKDGQQREIPEVPEDSIRIFKTVVKVISQHVLNTMGHAPPQLQWFLPFLVRFESDTRDEELRQDCVAALACLSQMALSNIESAEMLKQIETIVRDPSPGIPWRDRVLALEHLQTAVFSNFFNIKSHPDWVRRTQELTLQSLESEFLEVREMACVTLAGLVQCSFLTLDKPLLDRFFYKSNTKYRTDDANGKSSAALLQRHAGVLGLCAYVIAQPYSIGQHEPDVLVILSGHINDPQPINQTVKNTIKEFRRTHLDNWSEHKVKFTEDQLAVLTDLLVSPTYYA